MPEKDLVQEAREMLALMPKWFFTAQTARAPELLSSLCNELEEQRRRNQTQADSIMEFQEEQRRMREAIEAAIRWINCEPVLDDDGIEAMRLLRAAITPKGEKKES